MDDVRSRIDGVVEEFVDLDGPLLQVDDVPDALHFSDGWVEPPAPALWG